MANTDFDTLRRSIYLNPSDLSNLLHTKRLSRQQKIELIDASKYLDTFKSEGVVIIRKAVTELIVKEAVADIWQSIINLPLIEAEKEKWNNLHNSFKSDYWRDCTKKEAKLIKEIYPMTGGFGALTLPPAFNLATQWKIRQDPLLVNIAKNVLDADKVMVSLDRVSFKATGQGETEFAHWDSNPFMWENEEYHGFQGIVALCETSFWAIPKTHTDNFRDTFVTLYPKSNRVDQYYVNDNHDPLNLLSQTQEYKLEPGDYIIWSNRLLHEARINKSSKIRYAYFISYFPYDNPPLAVKQYYSKLGDTVTEHKKDRIRSYQTGRNPLVFPSGTPVQLYAKSHLMYHPEVLNKFCDRLTTGKDIYIYKSGKKKGQSVAIPVNYDPVSLGIYVPPNLSDLGKELLGMI